MKVLVINPNTTGAMTTLVTGRLHSRLGAAFQLIGLTAQQGHAVIATPSAFDAAAPAALALLRQAQAQGIAHDAVVLACFGDPGLEALRSESAAPVVGLAESAMQQAAQRGRTYAIVTAGAAWEGLLTQRLLGWGAGALFTGVQVIEGTGLDVLKDPDGALPRVVQAMERARGNGAHTVILGGAVFAGYRDVLHSHGVPTDDVLEGVQTAAQVLQSLSPVQALRPGSDSAGI